MLSANCKDLHSRIKSAQEILPELLQNVSSFENLIKFENEEKNEKTEKIEKVEE